MLSKGNSFFGPVGLTCFMNFDTFLSFFFFHFNYDLCWYTCLTLFYSYYYCLPSSSYPLWPSSFSPGINLSCFFLSFAQCHVDVTVCLHFHHLFSVLWSWYTPHMRKLRLRKESDSARSFRKSEAKPRLEPGCFLLVDNDIVYLCFNTGFLCLCGNNESGSNLRQLRGGIGRGLPLLCISQTEGGVLATGPVGGGPNSQLGSPGGFSPSHSGVTPR